MGLILYFQRISTSHAIPQHQNDDFVAVGKSRFSDKLLVNIDMPTHDYYHGGSKLKGPRIGSKKIRSMYLHWTTIAHGLLLLLCHKSFPAS